MASVSVTLTTQENTILTAHATLNNTTVQALVTANGVTNAVNQAINAEVAKEVAEKSVGSDITALLAEDVWAVTNKVTQLYQQGNIPASLLTTIQARAAALTPPAASTTTSGS